MKGVQNSVRRNYLKVNWIAWNNIMIHLTLQTNMSLQVNRRRGQKRKRLFSSSESKSDVEDLSTEIAPDGTIWQETEQGSISGRAPIYNIFREVVSSTAYAKRNIMKGKVRTAFSLIIDKCVMKHIRKCIEEEASRVL
ncbi:uncharacterized protein TNCV_3129411 [Trichonephila clavipes]|nr:uncharacterized protein TNCV_3129411 [Trichonephila clavipes]